MTIELIVQDNETGKIFNISEIASNISLSSQISDQPGKLTFNYLDDGDLLFHEGSPVSFKVNGVGMFFGSIFTKETTSNNVYTITAYNQLYYLKNKDTYVFKGSTASERFEKICLDKKLKYKILNPSTYKVVPSLEDNVSYYDMIQNSLDRTLVGEGNWYIIRDNFGTLEYVSVNSLKTLLYIGDESLLVDYSYKSSIDGDTYNQVKIIKENKETAKREVYIVKDSTNIKKWGLLQYFEKVDEKANEAQIKARADMILKIKNRVVRTLKLNCLGDTSISAGNGIILGISDLVKESIPMNRYFIVTSCTHNFSNELHTMSLELVVSV